MKDKKIIMNKNLSLNWVVLIIIIVALLVIIYRSDIATGFKDGYNSVPK